LGSFKTKGQFIVALWFSNPNLHWCKTGACILINKYLSLSFLLRNSKVPELSIYCM
jgi:hypothetical protein